jgi:hypothetical protein
MTDNDSISVLSRAQSMPPTGATIHGRSRLGALHMTWLAARRRAAR